MDVPDYGSKPKNMQYITQGFRSDTRHSDSASMMSKWRRTRAPTAGGRARGMHVLAVVPDRTVLGAPALTSGECQHLRERNWSTRDFRTCREIRQFQASDVMFASDALFTLR